MPLWLHAGKHRRPASAARFADRLPWQANPAYRRSLSQERDSAKTRWAKRSDCVTPGAVFVLFPRLVPYAPPVHGTRGTLPDGGQSAFPPLPQARGRGIEKKAIHL